MTALRNRDDRASGTPLGATPGTASGGPRCIHLHNVEADTPATCAASRTVEPASIASTAALTCSTVTWRKATDQPLPERRFANGIFAATGSTVHFACCVRCL